jgi:hypothetical protein
MITTINEFKQFINECIDLSKYVNEYVNEYLDNEFYINNYRYEENIDDDTDDEKIINDEEYKSWLKYDIEFKLDEINNIIDSPLTLYRKMSVDNNWFKQLKEYTKLGIYWSYESNVAETHWGYINNKKPNLVELIITINRSNVDIDKTYSARLLPYTGDEEKEITLLDNTIIKLDKIIINDIEQNIDHLKKLKFKA